MIGLLLGLYNFVGGSCVTLGALGPRGETPDLPFYTANQQRALEAYVQAAASLDPGNAAVGVLVGLVGAVLFVGAVLQFSTSPQRGLIGQFAFGASMVVDLLQIVWLAVWYALLWGPTVEYVRASMSAFPNQPPGLEDSLGLVTFISVGLTILLGAAYFGVKIALAAVALRSCVRADRVLDGTESSVGAVAPAAASAPSRASEPGLDWALDEPTEDDEPTEEGAEPGPVDDPDSAG